MVFHELDVIDIQKLLSVLNLFENKRLHLIDVGDEFSKRVPAKGDFSVEIYYRILAINLLPDSIEKILYLDVDTIVKGDLSELFDIDLTGVPFGVCEDLNACVHCMDVQNGAGISRDNKYFNSGLLLMNISYIRERKLDERIIERFYNEHEKYTYVDQDILNNEFVNQVKYLPFVYNYPPILFYLDMYKISDNEIKIADYNVVNQMHEEWVKKRYVDMTDIMMEKAKMIHYIGDTKPWKHRNDEMNWVHEMYRHFWIDYENKLLELL